MFIKNLHKSFIKVYSNYYYYIIFKLINISIIYYLLLLVHNYLFLFYNINIYYLLIINILCILIILYQYYINYINYNKVIIYINTIFTLSKQFFIKICLLINNNNKYLGENYQINNNDNIIDIYDENENNSESNNDINDSEYSYSISDTIYSNNTDTISYFKNLIILYISYYFLHNLKCNKQNYNNYLYQNSFSYETFINNELYNIYHNLQINKNDFCLNYCYYLINKKIINMNKLSIIKDIHYSEIMLLLQQISILFDKLFNIFQLYQKNKIINSELYIIILLLNLTIHLITTYKEDGIYYIIIISFILFSLNFIKYKILYIFNFYSAKKLINFLDEIYLINYFNINSINYDIH